MHDYRRSDRLAQGVFLRLWAWLSLSRIKGIGSLFRGGQFFIAVAVAVWLAPDSFAEKPSVSSVVVEQMLTSVGDPDPELMRVRFKLRDADNDRMRIRIVTYGEGGPVVLADSDLSTAAFEWEEHPGFVEVPPGDYEFIYKIPEGDRPPLGPTGSTSILFEITADDGKGSGPSQSLRVRETEVGGIRMVEIPDEHGKPWFHISQTEVTYSQWAEVVRRQGDQSDGDPVSGTQYIELARTDQNASEEDKASHPNLSRLHSSLVWLNFLSQESGRDPAFLNQQGDIIFNDLHAEISDIKMEQDGSGYRLPTVEEWLYACNALGRPSPAGNVDSKTTEPVRSYDWNGFGLFDMSGSLSEYAWDDSGDHWDGHANPPVVICGSDLESGPLPCRVSDNDWQLASDLTGSVSGRTGLRIVTRERPHANAFPNTITVPGADGEGGSYSAQSSWTSVDLTPRIDPRPRDPRTGRLMRVAGEPMEIGVNGAVRGAAGGVAPLVRHNHLSAEADGLIYQWFRNETPLQDEGVFSGSHTPTLKISAVGPELNGNRFHAVVSSSNTSIEPGISATTTLQVADSDELKLGVATGFPDWRWETGGHSDFEYNTTTLGRPAALASVDGGETSIIQATMVGRGFIRFRLNITIPPEGWIAAGDKLEFVFFMDGRPMDVFNANFAGKEVGYPIPSGKHKLRWSLNNYREEDTGKVGGLIYDVHFVSTRGNFPVMFEEPVNIYTLNGETAYFYTLISGRDLEYQWFETSPLGLTPLPGQKGPWLILPNDGIDFEQRFFVVGARNKYGSLQTEDSVWWGEFATWGLNGGFDIPNIEFRTGGDRPWYPQSTELNIQQTDLKNFEVLANNRIGDLQSSWIETDVLGPKILTFDWSVSSEEGFDFLRFFLNGEKRKEISGRPFYEGGHPMFAQEYYFLSEGVNTLRWVYEKDPIDEVEDFTWNDQGYLDNMALFTAEDLGDALDAPNLTWTSGGDAHWVPDHFFYEHGDSSVRSGTLVNNESSWIQTRVTGPGTLSFKWSVSSPISSSVTQDYLRFYIDDVAQGGAINGEAAPAGEWYESLSQNGAFYEIPAGVHRLKWQFEKNESSSGEWDAGWLDKVVFTSTIDSTPGEIAPDPGTDAGGEKPTIGSPAIELILVPMGQNVVVGEPISLLVEASSESPLNYQWQKDGQPIPGATDAALSLPSAQFVDSGLYSVEVRNEVETIVTDGVEVIVEARLPVAPEPAVPEPPRIVSQPAATAVTQGEAVSLSVVAEGAGTLSYQWSLNGKEIAGANSPGYVIQSAQMNDVGVYTVVVGNEGGTVISDFAFLSVSEPEDPAAGEEVVFVDPQVEAAVRSAIDLPEGTITRNALTGLGRLDLRVVTDVGEELYLVDLEGLQFAHGLTTVNLELIVFRSPGCKIRFPAGLRTLGEITLSDNGFGPAFLQWPASLDLTVLAQSTQLGGLVLYNDDDSLVPAPALEYVIRAKQGIWNEPSTSEDLLSLETLDLSATPLDLLDRQELFVRDRLDLNNRPIYQSDLKRLSKQLGESSFEESPDWLKELALSEAERQAKQRQQNPWARFSIEDLLAAVTEEARQSFQLLSGFSKLRELDLSGNGLTELDVSGLPSLEVLELASNQVERLALSNEISSMKRLDVSGNPIRCIGADENVRIDELIGASVNQLVSLATFDIEALRIGVFGEFEILPPTLRFDNPSYPLEVGDRWEYRGFGGFLGYSSTREAVSAELVEGIPIIAVEVTQRTDEGESVDLEYYAQDRSRSVWKFKIERSEEAGNVPRIQDRELIYPSALVMANPCVNLSDAFHPGSHSVDLSLSFETGILRDVRTSRGFSGATGLLLSYFEHKSFFKENVGLVRSSQFSDPNLTGYVLAGMDMVNVSDFIELEPVDDGLPPRLGELAEMAELEVVGNRTVWIDDQMPVLDRANVGIMGAGTWQFSAKPIGVEPTMGRTSLVVDADDISTRLDFSNALPTMPVGKGAILVADVFLSAVDPPEAFEIAWTSADGRTRIRSWAAPSIWPPWGFNTDILLGDLNLPAAGEWIRLEVPASKLELEDSEISGLAIVVRGGEMAFDGIGVIEPIQIQTPRIVEQPQATTVVLASPVRMTVAVEGGGTLAYQWSLNGKEIEGANQAEYVIESASESDRGVYTVVVNNEAGMVISQFAFLDVLAAVEPTLGGSTFDDIELRADGSIALIVTGDGSSSVAVEASGDLIRWLRLGVIDVSSGRGEFVDETAGLSNERYYRLVPIDQP